MAYRSLCVTDTNVWIDLDAANLIDLIFELPWRLCAPDVIVAELERPEGEALVRRGLVVRDLPGAGVAAVVDLAARYPRPSRADLFALVLAQREGAALLTGDRHLREAAEREGLEVHGTLWIVDRLMDFSLLSGPDAAKALLRMREAGRRLPAEEVEKRLRTWTAG